MTTTTLAVEIEALVRTLEATEALYSSGEPQSETLAAFYRGARSAYGDCIARLRDLKAGAL